MMLKKTDSVTETNVNRFKFIVDLKQNIRTSKYAGFFI